VPHQHRGKLVKNLCRSCYCHGFCPDPCNPSWCEWHQKFNCKPNGIGLGLFYALIDRTTGRFTKKVTLGEMAKIIEG
jgi:hypothetical protein